MRILAISGWKKSGKDTLANHLVDNHGFERRGFADDLKREVIRKYGLTSEQVFSQELKELPLPEYPITPTDDFSLMIAKKLFREFRGAAGEVPVTICYGEGRPFSGIDKKCKEFRLFQTPRSILILEGSAARSVDNSIWVKRAFNDTQTKGLYVVSDWRYRSEVETMRKLPGAEVITFRVDRFDTSPSADGSERDLDLYPFDHWINNRGEKGASFAQVETILRERNWL